MNWQKTIRIFAAFGLVGCSVAAQGQGANTVLLAGHWYEAAGVSSGAPANPIYDPSAFTSWEGVPATSAYGYLYRRKLAYNTNLGDARVVVRDAFPGSAQVIPVNGRTTVQQLAYDPTFGLWMRFGYFDSLRFGTQSYYSPNQFRQVFMHRSAAGQTSILWEQPDTTQAMTVYNGKAALMSAQGGFGGPVRLTEVTTNGQVLRRKDLYGLGYGAHIERLSNGGFMISGSCAVPLQVADGVAVPANAPAYNRWVAYLNKNWTLKWIRVWEDITCDAPRLTPVPATFLGPNGYNTAAFVSGTTSVGFTLDGQVHAGPALGGSDVYLFALDTLGSVVSPMYEVPGTSGFIQMRAGVAAPALDVSGGLWFPVVHRGEDVPASMGVNWSNGWTPGATQPPTYQVLLRLYWTSFGWQTRWNVAFQDSVYGSIPIEGVVPYPFGYAQGLGYSLALRHYGQQSFRVPQMAFDHTGSSNASWTVLASDDEGHGVVDYQSTLGAEEPEQRAERVYPQPVRAGQRVRWDVPPGAAGQVRCFDAQGRCLAEWPMASGAEGAAVGNWAPGFYTLVFPEGAAPLMVQ